LEEKIYDINKPAYKKVGKPIAETDEIREDVMSFFNSGSSVAFTEVYNKFYPSVFYFARRFVNPEDAEDITADSFYKLWKINKSFPSLQSVKVFLQVNVRNACINHLEHIKVVEKNKHALFFSVDKMTDEYNYSDEIKAEQIKHILAEIEKLPARRKIVFKLACLEGLKEKEIAAKLKLSIGTVHNHKTIAIKQLRMAALHIFFIMLSFEVFYIM
jgi:RNA polymerase sigma-70 factor (family 1)